MGRRSKHHYLVTTLFGLLLVDVIVCQRETRRHSRYSSDGSTTASPNSMLANGWRPLVPSSSAWPQGRQHPVMSKVQAHLEAVEKKRHQHTAGSSKVEVFAPAPPSILGSFSVVSQAAVKPRDKTKKKKLEQNDFPDQRAVYSAHLVPPPVQQIPPVRFTFQPSDSKQPFKHNSDFRTPHKSELSDAAFTLSPPAPSAEYYFDKYNFNGGGSFSSNEQNRFRDQHHSYIPPKKQYNLPKPVPTININLEQSFPSNVPKHNPHQGEIFKSTAEKLTRAPQNFRILPSSHEENQASAAHSFQTSRDTTKFTGNGMQLNNNPEIEKQEFYVKHVTSPPFFHQENRQEGNILYGRPAVKPTDIQVSKAQEPQITIYATPLPETAQVENNKPLPPLISFSAFQEPTFASTPAPIDLFVTSSPFVTELHPLFNTVSPTLATKPRAEAQRGPVSFLPTPTVKILSAGEKGRITRPYFKEEMASKPEMNNMHVAGSVPKRHKRPQFSLAVPNGEHEEETALSTIPPDSKIFLQRPEFSEQVTTRPEDFNEVSPTFKNHKYESQSFVTEVYTAMPVLDVTTAPEEIIRQDPVTKVRQRPTRPRRPVNSVYRRPNHSQKQSYGTDSNNNVPESSILNHFEQEIHSDINKMINSKDNPIEQTTVRAEQYDDNDHSNTQTFYTRRPAVISQTYTNDISNEQDDNYDTSTKPSYHTRVPTRPKLNNQESSQENSVQEVRRPYRLRRPTIKQSENSDSNNNSVPHDRYNRNRQQTRIHSSRRPVNQYQNHRPSEELPTTQRQENLRRRRPYSQKTTAPTVTAEEVEQTTSDDIRKTEQLRESQFSFIQPQTEATFNTEIYKHTSPKSVDKSPGEKLYHRSPYKDRLRGTPSSLKTSFTDQYTEEESYITNRPRRPTKITTNQPISTVTQSSETTLLPEGNHFYGVAYSTDAENEIKEHMLLSGSSTSTTTTTTEKPSRRNPEIKLRDKERYSSRIRGPSKYREQQDTTSTLDDLPAELLHSKPELERLPQSNRQNYDIHYDTSSESNHNLEQERNEYDYDGDDDEVADVGHNTVHDEITENLQSHSTSSTSSTTTTTTTTTTTPPPTTTTTTTSTTTTTTPAPKTTSTTTQSTLSSRLRPKLRYGANSTRPRFSVKDYKERLNRIHQRNDDNQENSSNKNEVDVPSTNRMRYTTRPRGSYTHRPEEETKKDDSDNKPTSTEPSRLKYRPKDFSRYTPMRSRTSTTFVPEIEETVSVTTTTTTTPAPTTTTSTTTTTTTPSTTTERVNNFKPSNSRYRPPTGKYYSRYRSTTSSSVDDDDDENDDENHSTASTSTTTRGSVRPKGVYSAARRTYNQKPQQQSDEQTSSNIHSITNHQSDIYKTSERNSTPVSAESEEDKRKSYTFKKSKPDKVDNDYSFGNLASFSAISSEQQEHLMNKFSAAFAPVSDEIVEGFDVKTTKSDQSTSPTTRISEVTITDDFADSMTEDYVSPSQRVADLTSLAKGVFDSSPPISRQHNLRITMATDNPVLPIEAFFAKAI